MSQQGAVLQSYNNELVKCKYRDQSVIRPTQAECGMPISYQQKGKVK